MRTSFSILTYLYGILRLPYRYARRRLFIKFNKQLVVQCNVVTSQVLSRVCCLPQVLFSTSSLRSPIYIYLRCAGSIFHRDILRDRQFNVGSFAKNYSENLLEKITFVVSHYLVGRKMCKNVYFGFHVPFMHLVSCFVFGHMYHVSKHKATKTNVAAV